MRLFGFEALILAGLGVGAGLGAAGRPGELPGSHLDDRAGAGRLARPGAPADPNALAGTTSSTRPWGSQGLRHGDHRAGSAGRVNQVYQLSLAVLDGVAWTPAEELRENLPAWLRPRVRLAWAGRRLVDTILAMPTAPLPRSQGNRDRWRQFLDHDLGQALRSYDAAATVAERQKGLRSVNACWSRSRRETRRTPGTPRWNSRPP